MVKKLKNKIKELLTKYHDIPVAAKATLWFMICSIIQKGISFITTPIFSRLMSTTQYGQFNVYNSWLQIFTIATTLRLNYAVFNKGMSKYKDRRDDYTSTMQSITFVLAIACLLIYFVFQKLFNNLTELPTLIMVAIFIELTVTPAIEFWSLRKRYEYQYKPVVYRTLAMAILNAIVGVIVVSYSTEKGYSRIMTCIVVNIVFGGWLFVVNRKKSKVWFDKELAKFAILFNIPLLIHYLSQYILDQFDRIMIQKMVGMAAAGIYGVAYNMGMLMKIVTQSINSAIIPWQYEKLEKREFKILDDTLFWIYVLVAGVAFLLSCFAPEVMRILAPEEYYEGVYCITPVALGLVFSFMYTTWANVEFFFNLNKFTMYVSVIGALSNVVLNYIFIKIYGYVAAAYTTLFCYALFALGHFIYISVSLRKKHNISKIFESKRLIILSASIVLLGLFVIQLYDNYMLRYGFVAILAIVGVIKRKSIINVISNIKKTKHGS